VLLGAPLAARGRRAAATARAAALGGDVDAIARRGVHWRSRLRISGWLARGTAPAIRVFAALGRLRRDRRADTALARELPVAIDLLGVAVGAGCTPYLAVEAVTRWGPPVVAARFRSVLRACELGSAFGAALDAMGSETRALARVADALRSAERTGSPIGPALGRLASEERGALRRRAEAHARRVPVRLLFPLVFLVLPAFVLLTVVPGLVAGLARL
jgi:tight adherence protein C